MTIILDLPNELERELSHEAAQQGLPLAEYALQLLVAGRGSGPDAAAPRTGAELVAYWQSEDLIGSRSDIEDPVQHARDLRERAQTRRGS